MKVITGAEQRLAIITLTVSDVSMPGHPSYDVDVRPSATGYELTWKDSRKIRFVSGMADAINTALTEKQSEDEEEVDPDTLGYDYVDGRNARRQGLKLNDCPHLKLSPQGKAWVHGWRDRDLETLEATETNETTE